MDLFYYYWRGLGYSLLPCFNEDDCIKRGAMRDELDREWIVGAFPPVTRLLPEREALIRQELAKQSMALLPVAVMNENAVQPCIAEIDYLRSQIEQLTAGNNALNETKLYGCKEKCVQCGRLFYVGTECKNCAI